MRYALVLLLCVALDAFAQSKFKNVGVDQFDKTPAANETPSCSTFARRRNSRRATSPGAVNIDWNADDFGKKIAALDKSKTYLVHCAVGGRSAKASDKMTTLQFTDVYNLEGGIKAWKRRASRSKNSLRFGIDRRGCRAHLGLKVSGNRMDSFIYARHSWCFSFNDRCVVIVCSGVTRSRHGFESIFDGKTLKGWHVSGKTGHSRASTNMTGGKWVVENGAIVGSQDIPGNGGIVITDEQFGDFEVVLEMNNDFGPDSGLFLRSTEDGQGVAGDDRLPPRRQCYGHLWRRLGGKPSVRNYSFLDTPDKIQTNDAPFPFAGLCRSLAQTLEARPVERTARPHRKQPACHHDLDQWDEVHGVERDREAPPGQGRHRAAGPRRRRSHEKNLFVTGIFA
jgi:rhodanese-related sulfurtransferase